MSNVKHTPGPWKFHAQGDANDYCLLTNEKRWVIGFLQNGEIFVGEQLANARLVAAAPELLDALKKYVEAGAGDTTSFYKQAEAYDAAIEAIAKAEGQS